MLYSLIITLKHVTFSVLFSQKLVAVQLLDIFWKLKGQRFYVSLLEIWAQKG